MKKIILITLLIAPILGYAQKVKIKKDVAYVEGEAFLVWDSQLLGTEISVHHINSEDEEIFITYQEYTSPEKVTKTNPDGSVNWIELNFLTLNKKFEIQSRFHKGIVKFLIKNKVYVNGKINEKAVDKLVSKYGMKISESKPAPKSESIKIIINN